MAVSDLTGTPVPLFMLHVINIYLLPAFTQKDFNGIIDIGIGSKRDDPSKIGKFGKGALTM